MMKPLLVLGALFSALSAVACGSGSGSEVENVGLRAETQLPKRAGAVVIDGCVVDNWQRSTLGLASTKRVVQQVILLCLIPREDGTVGPRDPSARAALIATAADLRNEGYRVNLGVAFTDESGARYDGAQTRAYLADRDWRSRFRDTLAVFYTGIDGIEIDLQFLPNDARPFVTSLVSEISPFVRVGNRQLNVFIPPSVANPSDLPGGEAFSRRELAPLVDRMRVMTLDFSESAPGPTIDPGWAVDAIRLARNDFANVDVSVPLYGTDFGPRGRRTVIYHEARTIALMSGVSIERGPTGAPFVSYRAFGGEQHQLWFDDAESTGRALGAWSYDVMPADVGVLYYGLGAEDPALFDRLGARLP